MSQELEYLSQQVARGRSSRRDFLGRAAALGVSATVANALLASAARAAGPVKGGTIKQGLVGGAATNTLDPALNASQVPFHIQRTWAEELVRVSGKGVVEPLLATEWGSSPDAKIWTFKIRKGVTFHNGKELSPDDVVATMERHAGKETKSGAAGIMRGIDSVKRNGDTVVFTLKDPDADLPFLIGDYHLAIQPNGGKDAPNAGIGTGAYKVASFEPGVRYVGTRNPNYWAADKRGFADQVEVLVLNDSTARTAALQSGQVHMINRVDPKVVDLIKRVPGVKIRNISGRGHYVFVMHCNTAPFDNADLRMALKLAVDRKEMVDKILRGFGSVGNDFPINHAYPLFSDDIEQRVYDPEKAAFHYKKSGHSGPILLRTSDVAFSGAVDAAQLFQASAAKAGMKLEVKREPGDGYWSEVWNKQPFCASYWSGRPVQGQMYSTAYITGADWNDTRFFNPKFDQLVKTAKAELDQAKRKAMYREMAVIVRDQGGAIVPMFNDAVDAISGKLGGYVDNPNAELMAGMAAVECWLEA